MLTNNLKVKYLIYKNFFIFFNLAFKLSVLWLKPKILLILGFSYFETFQLFYIKKFLVRNSHISFFTCIFKFSEESCDRRWRCFCICSRGTFSRWWYVFINFVKVLKQINIKDIDETLLARMSEQEKADYCERMQDAYADFY